MTDSVNMLLTSTGLSCERVYREFVDLVEIKKLKKAVIITTASKDKNHNEYAISAREYLYSGGIQTVDFYDFEYDGLVDLSSYDIIYVCGGNTFTLMKFARIANFHETIKLLFKKGGLYIGVSAGSLIVGPSILIANEITPDKNDADVTNFEGLSFVDFVVFPHYSSNLESDIKLFEINNNVDIKRIDNSQAVVVYGNNTSKII